MSRYVLTVALVLGCVVPAFAAKGFWITRGPDRKCVVVETEPSAKETTVTKVGKDVYVTREEAEADIGCRLQIELRGGRAFGCYSLRFSRHFTS